MNPLIVKTELKGDIRKLKIKETKFLWLKKRVSNSYNLGESNFKMTYLDEEGDAITIGNQQDLLLATETITSGKLLKIQVKALNKPKELIPLVKSEEQVGSLEVVDSSQQNLKDQENSKPLLKLQPPKPQQEKLTPLLKLQPPKPQPKKVEGEEIKPLLKLQKPKPQPKQAKGEEIKPLLKLQKPKPQPKQSEEKPVKKEYPFMEALKEMITMGFADNKQVRVALRQNKGNIEATINVLLSQK